MKLMDFVSTDSIMPDLEPAPKDDLLSTMVGRLQETGKIGNPRPLLEKLLEREKIMSTGIGMGIAVPHAVSDEVEDLVIALARIPAGTDYDSLDGEPVNFIFLLVGSPNAQTRHLKTLARISRLVQHTQFVNSIKGAASADEILKILAEEDGKHKG